MDKKDAIEKVELYADAVCKAFQPQAIIVYGSYAKGDFNDTSDIDVAVIFNGFTGNFLEASSKLWKLRRNISDDIESILLDSTKDDNGFINEIFKTGQVIYATLQEGI